MADWGLIAPLYASSGRAERSAWRSAKIALFNPDNSWEKADMNPPLNENEPPKRQ